MQGRHYEVGDRVHVQFMDGWEQGEVTETRGPNRDGEVYVRFPGVKDWKSRWFSEAAVRAMAERRKAERRRPR